VARKIDPRSQAIECAPSQPSAPVKEIAFEKQRGISQVEVRGGFAQVHVSQIRENIHERRLQVLKAVREASVSVDFLKLTPSGLSFLISEAHSGDIERALEPLNLHCSIRKDRCVVLVHAVNMRDEEGLTAQVVQRAIASGAIVDHVSDMHDRMLIVAEMKYATTLQQLFSEGANGS
jgi:aspartokinase